MNPAEFLEVAERLQGSTLEAERRTSIGRSYYAVFNEIRSAVEKHRPVLGDRAHACLLHYLFNAPNTELKATAILLNELRTARTDADYEMGMEIGAERSAQMVRKAQKALDKFRAIPYSYVKNALISQPVCPQSRR